MTSDKKAKNILKRKNTVLIKKGGNSRPEHDIAAHKITGDQRSTIGKIWKMIVENVNETTSTFLLCLLYL